MSAKGLPGKRVEAKRAGIIPKIMQTKEKRCRNMDLSKNIGNFAVEEVWNKN
jgi:hypothetical protein